MNRRRTVQNRGERKKERKNVWEYAKLRKDGQERPNATNHWQQEAGMHTKENSVRAFAYVRSRNGKRLKSDDIPCGGGGITGGLEGSW
jgi:hypothetical protein